MPSGGAALLLALSAVCAGIMGFAIQRGATCMVAALEEVVERRRFNRVLALLEAAAIVAGGLAVAKVADLLHTDPAAWQLTLGTLLGGVLLGLGAFIAQACVFGSIARLGSGEWAYLLVPPGFLVGCLLARPLEAVAMPEHSNLPSPLLGWAALVLLPLGAFLIWRIYRVWQAGRQGMLLDHIWSPHIATSVIGLAFVVLLLTVGPWSYTEALAEAARGMAMMTPERLLLFACLLGGAVLGGWAAGRLRVVRPSNAALARCAAGGAMMGAGSVLIPGSNDGLILVGLPLLQPHAWAALLVMGATIWAALALRRSRAMAPAGNMA